MSTRTLSHMVSWRSGLSIAAVFLALAIDPAAAKENTATLPRHGADSTSLPATGLSRHTETSTHNRSGTHAAATVCPALRVADTGAAARRAAGEGSYDHMAAGEGGAYRISGGEGGVARLAAGEGGADRFAAG